MDKISQQCYFAWESLQWGFCDVSCSCSFIFVLHFVVVLHLLLFFIFVAVLHSLLFNVIPHPSVDYRRVFTLILYFQPSPSHSDSRHFHFSTILLSSYHERYGFEWAFFTHRRFLPYAPSRHFWHSQHFGTTCFYQGFTGSWQLLSWKLQGFILILETQTRPICLFDSQ